MRNKKKLTYVCFMHKDIKLTHVVDDDDDSDTFHVHKQQHVHDVYKVGILSHWHKQHFHAYKWKDYYKNSLNIVLLIHIQNIPRFPLVNLNFYMHSSWTT